MLILQPNSTENIDLTAYSSTDCTSKTTSYTVITNGTPNPNFKANQVVNSLDRSKYTCTTSTTNSSNFDSFLILPALIMAFILKKKSKKQ